jgi:soluble lytic murein transglycosylase-like protein
MRKSIIALLMTLSISSSAIAEEVLFKNKVVQFIEDTYKISNAKTIVDYVFEIADRKRLDPTLVLGIISVESSFQTAARNPSGATGLMQVLLPMHCNRFPAPTQRECKALAHDPYQNIDAGTDILIEFKGDLRRYSGGATAYKAKVTKAQDEFYKLYKEINNGAGYY